MNLFKSKASGHRLNYMRCSVYFVMVTFVYIALEFLPFIGFLVLVVTNSTLHLLLSSIWSQRILRKPWHASSQSNINPDLN